MGKRSEKLLAQLSRANLLVRVFRLILKRGGNEENIELTICWASFPHYLKTFLWGGETMTTTLLTSAISHVDPEQNKWGNERKTNMTQEQKRGERWEIHCTCPSSQNRLNQLCMKKDVLVVVSPHEKQQKNNKMVAKLHSNIASESSRIFVDSISLKRIKDIELQPSTRSWGKSHPNIFQQSFPRVGKQ